LLGPALAVRSCSLRCIPVPPPVRVRHVRRRARGELRRRDGHGGAWLRPWPPRRVGDRRRRGGRGVRRRRVHGRHGLVTDSRLHCRLICFCVIMRLNLLLRSILVFYSISCQMLDEQMTPTKSPTIWRDSVMNRDHKEIRPSASLSPESLLFHRRLCSAAFSFGVFFTYVSLVWTHYSFLPIVLHLSHFFICCTKTTQQCPPTSFPFISVSYTWDPPKQKSTIFSHSPISLLRLSSHRPPLARFAPISCPRLPVPLCSAQHRRGPCSSSGRSPARRLAPHRRYRPCSSSTHPRDVRANTATVYPTRALVARPSGVRPRTAAAGPARAPAARPPSLRRPCSRFVVEGEQGTALSEPLLVEEGARHRRSPV
jgi:hypothetical protein